MIKQEKKKEQVKLCQEITKSISNTYIYFQTLNNCILKNLKPFYYLLKLLISTLFTMNKLELGKLWNFWT